LYRDDLVNHDDSNVESDHAGLSDSDVGDDDDLTSDLHVNESLDIFKSLLHDQILLLQMMMMKNQIHTPVLFNRRKHSVLGIKRQEALPWYHDGGDDYDE
jgi:hypothetical protein